MMIHDAAGSIVVVSAESVKMAGEGCIVLNARAVYIHNQALTSEQAAIVKRGVMATLDDPAALEDLHGKHDVTGIDLPPRNGLGIDGDGMDAHVGKPDGLDEAVTRLQTFGEFTDRGGRRTSNYFQVLDIDPSECTGGNPYGFACRIKVGERSFDFDGLDMGDLQTMKGAINKAMTHARRARREWEGAQE